ncbi:MAG: hypothetical protein SNJ70_07580 [Armatimonadota bacterium]
MKTPTINILTLATIFLLLFNSVCFSDEIKNIEIYPMDNINPIIFEAPIIESISNIIRAYGGVKIYQGNKVMTASEAIYDYIINFAVLKDASFTTCPGDCPDYTITAKEIIIDPGGSITANRVRLYIRNTSIISLPSWKGRIDGNSSPEEIFPTPGYNPQEGFTLNNKFRLINRKDMLCFLNLAYSTKSSFIGSLQNEIAIDGELGSISGRFLTNDSIRDNSLNLRRETDKTQNINRNKISKLRFNQKIILSERVNDIGDKGLKLFTIPELSIRYIEDDINIAQKKTDSRLIIHPEAELIWSRFKEVPGQNEYRTKYFASVKLPINAYMPNKNTAFHPGISYDWIQYGNTNTYQHWAYYLDIAHITQRKSLLNIRYIRREDKGSTEYEIDNIDIKEELQAGIHYENNRHSIGAVLCFDTQKKTLYEWETFYAYKTDCLAGWFRWNQRLNRLVLSVSLINF